MEGTRRRELRIREENSQPHCQGDLLSPRPPPPRTPSEGISADCKVQSVLAFNPRFPAFINTRV